MKQHETVHEMFSQAAEKFRGDTAIVCADKSVTYGTLEDSSNNLANFLISSGAPKGSIVAIMAEDTIQVVTAMIGILKASCVFVPLDPNLPEKRLATMVSDVRPEWLIAESKFFSNARSLASAAASRAKLICLDRPGQSQHTPDDPIRADYAEYFNSAKPVATSDPDGMCYVYFTSGSTGRPKGIAGRLKAIDHFVRWEIKTFGVGEGTRVSQFTTPSFDAFLRDVFVPLSAGGVVCVPSGRDTILDARKLIDWIEIQEINLIHCVPSLFRSIVTEELNPNYFSSLKYILMAGEPLLPADVRRWVDVYSERTQLVNLYGPSETTMTKFFYFVKPSDKDRRFIPIGKPMQGAAAVVVDAAGRPCAPGSVGEIYIRTPYRTLGYYDQRELTGEVFIQNPFSDDPSDVIYKTGDLGRILEDGNFEFLGRKDHQVKVRGVRVELQEIENLLRSHEAVKDAVVVDREDPDGNKYLYAYVVLSKRVESSHLKSFLSEYLPENIVPSAFGVMESLPRTITGKVNRQALPAPGQDRSEIGVAFVAPRTPVEETLAGIWAQVLGIAQVGINDNFFELGGHSLLAMRLLSRVRSSFDLEVPLHALFEMPTVAELALAITQLQVERGRDDEMIQALEEIKSLSEDEIERLLAEETHLAGNPRSKVMSRN